MTELNIPNCTISVARPTDGETPWGSPEQGTTPIASGIPATLVERISTGVLPETGRQYVINRLDLLVPRTLDVAEKDLITVDGTTEVYEVESAATVPRFGPMFHFPRPLTLRRIES